VLPTIGTFAVSFFLVGMYWMIHHRTFQSVRRVDQGLLWLNLAALMLVCLFPFSTSFTMRYSVLGAIEVYYGNLLLAGLAFLALGVYALRRGLVPDRERRRVRAGRVRNLAALGVFAAAMVIALWNVSVAEKAWIAITPAILLARRFVPGGK
jgi:TMEM175 potassium channel family protein